MPTNPRIGLTCQWDATGQSLAGNGPVPSTCSPRVGLPARYANVSVAWRSWKPCIRSAKWAISDVVDAILRVELVGFVTGEILHVHGGQTAGH